MTTKLPDALLILGTHCPHCPTVLQGLSELVKQGRIGRLEVVNLDAHPEVAESLGIRAVPWLRLGPFELEGLRSPAELRQWAERAVSATGLADYFAELLKDGQLGKVISHIERDPDALNAVMQLLADPDTELQIRLGIGAIMESFAATDTIRRLVPALGELAGHENARLRNDACHYLGLTGSPDAVPYLKTCLSDADPDVREVAEESLDTLRESGIYIE